MKLMCVILSIAILFAGCYANAPLTKDSTLNLDKEELTFYLTDGTHIKSKSEEHHRVENGYRVSGKLVNTNQWWNTTSDFDGIVLDEQIKDIAIKQIDTTLTVVLAAVIVGGIAYLIIDSMEPFKFGL